MIEWFPYERAPLGRTHLRYVDLDAVLTDGKADRSSRAPGFVLLYYGEDTEVIFVLDDEPVTAVRVAERQRSVLSLAAARRRATAEREWADVAYFLAPEPQLRAMYATASSPPNLATMEMDVGRPGHIFNKTRESEYSGVIEFREKNRKVHYMVFMEGLPVHGFFSDQRRASDMRAHESLSTRLERLFQPSRVEGMRATGYPHVSELPVQAPPALADVYAHLITAAVSATSEAIEPALARKCFGDALTRLGEARPALRGYRLADNGRLEGESMAAVDDLTDSIAALLFDALGAADRAGAPSPPVILERITRDNRFLLQANRFFDRFPWPVTAD
ncbi:MAG TPA: hypothetical protein VMN78_10610 [Longimicrobiales bacterium]|nr:hypothetical protein [Longimicrobiales bacterium]